MKIPQPTPRISSLRSAVESSVASSILGTMRSVLPRDQWLPFLGSLVFSIAGNLTPEEFASLVGAGAGPVEPCGNENCTCHIRMEALRQAIKTMIEKAGSPIPANGHPWYMQG